MTRLAGRTAPVFPPPLAGTGPAKVLLIVGPQPPPAGGATLTVRALLDELARRGDVQAALVDTRFALAYRAPRRLQFAGLRRAGLILRDFARQVPRCDAVLVFANNGFIAMLLAPLYLLARRHGKPLWLKPIGGDLDLFLQSRPRPARWLLLRLLRALDGILPQTQLLCAVLAQAGCANSHYVPGLRPAAPALEPRPRRAGLLRLLYLSQIKPEKGVFVLLDALQSLAAEGEAHVACDFYGPIYEDTHARFMARLAQTPGARYCGLARPGSAIALMAGYDALVLPTHFASEGHPGVLVEAMQAGIAVISTRHRAIPELVTPGENGLLVPVRDSAALAQAIRRLARDPALRRRLAAANWRRGRQFQAEVVVPRLLSLIFDPSAHANGRG